jgi:MFS family permease
MADLEAESRGGGVLRNRHFLLLWLAQALSQTAQNAIWFGLVVVVEQVSKSGTQLGIAVMTTIIPPVVLGMAAGVLVDRTNKKAVLVVTNLLRALAVLGYLLYSTSLVYVYVVNLVLVSISQFFGPAEASTIPALVSRKQLISATSLFNLTFTGAQLAGIVLLGPPLIKLLGAEGLFITTSAAFAVSAILVWFLPRDERPAIGLQGLSGRRMVAEVWNEVREGWSFANSDRHIWSAMIHLTIVSGLLLVMSVLVPRFVVSVLGIGADNAAYIFAPAGFGVVLGTLLLPRLTFHFPKTTLVSGGLLTMGASLFGLTIISWGSEGLGLVFLRRFGIFSASGGLGLIPAVMVVVAVLGFAYALTSVPSQTILMENAPVESRGRIFAAQGLMSNVASVLPLVFLGGMADLFGVGLSFTIIGAGLCIAWAHNVRQWRSASSAEPSQT